MTVTTTTARVCAVCDIDISDRRRQARFCSSTCRARHFRGESDRLAGVCEGCGAKLDGARADARFCSNTCRSTAWRASRFARPATALNGFHPPSKVMTPAGDLDACTRCGASVGYVDEDGDRVCFMCGRLREGVVVPAGGGA
jgi:hypothetical protein